VKNQVSTKKTVLGKIAKISSGGTPSRGVSAYWNGDIPWVKTTQIQNCIINEKDVDEWITEEGLKKSSAKLIPAGTILMAMYGQGKTRGQVSILNFGAAINQACAAIEIKKDIDRQFIYQSLLGKYTQIRAMSNTGGQENLSAGLIKEIPILIPPIPEQKAIAALLSTWDKAVEKTERLIQAKEKRFCALLSKLISDNGQLTTGKSDWKKVKLGEVCKVITSNVDKKTLQNETLVRLCNYMDVYKNFYITSAMDFMEASATTSEILKFHLKKNDVLLTKDSETPDDIANSACVIENLRGVLCGYHLSILRPMQSIEGTYLNFALHTPRIRYEFSRQANGATRFGLTMQAYNMVEIPLPPLEEQKQIAETLSTAQQEIDLLKQLAEKYKTQKRGLMQKLLTGDWRIKPEILHKYKEA
jgi:type I restriction enzyme S subunit